MEPVTLRESCGSMCNSSCSGCRTAWIEWKLDEEGEEYVHKPPAARHVSLLNHCGWIA